MPELARNELEAAAGARPSAGEGCGAWGGERRGSTASWRHQEHGDMRGCGWLGPWPRWRHGRRRGAMASVETAAAVIEKQGEEGQTTMELTAVAEGVEAGSGKRWLPRIRWRRSTTAEAEDECNEDTTVRPGLPGSVEKTRTMS